MSCRDQTRQLVETLIASHVPITVNHYIDLTGTELVTNSLTEILRKTLAVIERNEEFRQDAPAIIELRRGMARAIGELEGMRTARPSEELDPPAKGKSRST